MKTFFYGLEGQERLSESPDEAIASHFQISDIVNDLPPVPVFMFTPRKIEVDEVGILEDILISIDEEYADPDGDNTEPTGDMIRAAKVLARTIERDYTSWACEKTGGVVNYDRESIVKILQKETS